MIIKVKKLVFCENSMSAEMFTNEHFRDSKIKNFFDYLLKIVKNVSNG